MSGSISRRLGRRIGLRLCRIVGRLGRRITWCRRGIAWRRDIARRCIPGNLGAPGVHALLVGNVVCTLRAVLGVTVRASATCATGQEAQARADPRAFAVAPDQGACRCTQHGAGGTRHDARVACRLTVARSLLRGKSAARCINRLELFKRHAGGWHDGNGRAHWRRGASG